ncbi:LysR family transcriptional regulator [Roseobacter sp. HKCCA0434]|uniref:LysR family transcriptional regulator n=1 Tax=Roseobacter sp. HKCCA0434 TaxID=3079297 RepID=UPI002905A12F|nr:LysR family transcriptional regulator [Roseobacter sp. HKCCA0434]
MARPYDLPRITALLCFETAARHLEFKSAARELNVTPAAISHQIKALEAELGVPLFRRRHRGVELTETGAFLMVALQRGLTTISDAVGDIRQRLATQDVVVQVSTAVSAFWLTPRIASFWTAHPTTTVSQIVTDHPDADPRADLVIEYGETDPDDTARTLLFRDRIIAVATPDYVARHGIAGPRDLLDAPLIHIAADLTHWTSWEEWLFALGLPAPRGQRLVVNNYMIALQLAQDHVGAVLGWEHLIAPLLSRGSLQALGAEALLAPAAFQLRLHRHASDRARVFADWLARQDTGLSESVASG